MAGGGRWKVAGGGKWVVILSDISLLETGSITQLKLDMEIDRDRDNHTHRKYSSHSSVFLKSISFSFKGSDLFRPPRHH